MPRLKRIKYKRLYLPEEGTADLYPNLAGTFARPIRWEIVEQQYDQMIKSTVALHHGTATSEAILKRYNSYNVTHPTYEALAEIGKTEKTIYLRSYLASRETRREVQEGLNVVKNWKRTKSVKVLTRTPACNFLRGSKKQTTEDIRGRPTAEES